MLLNKREHKREHMNILDTERDKPFILNLTISDSDNSAEINVTNIKDHFNHIIYSIFNKSTFVFITLENYTKLQNILTEKINSMDELSKDKSLKDILKEDVLYITSEQISDDDIQELGSLYEEFTQKKMDYIRLSK